MKKIVSILLLFTMICSSVVFAAENTTSEEMQKVLVSVKERIGDTSAFDKFESSTVSSEDGNTYIFYWSSRDKQNYSSINVECDENGIITRYNYYDDSLDIDSKASVNKMSSDEAMEKASSLVLGLNPSIADKIELVNNNKTENLYANDYTFTLKHMENGVEVYGDGGSVTVDINAEKIKNYRLTYTDDVNYENIENVISTDEAKAAYSEKLGLELGYESVYDENRELKIVPVYTEKKTNTNKYINALTGDIYEYDPYSEKYATANSGSGGGSALDAAREEAALSEAELEELQNVEGLLTKDEIIQLLSENEYLPLPSDYSFSDLRISKDYYDDEKRLARISFEKGESYGSLSYTVDAKDGDITNYYLYEDFNRESEIQLDKDEAYTLLKSAIEGLSGELFGEFGKEDYNYPEKSEDDAYTPSTATLVYTRMVNGIPYYSDTVSASVNIYTGKITAYYIQYTENADFPSIDSEIGYENAINALFDELDYDLYYMINDTNATPVYILSRDKSITIDALSGKFLNYSLEEYTPEFSGYDDLENHYAKDEIEKLAEYGIYFEGSSFLPDSEITQKDFIYMLNCCFGFSNPEPRPINSLNSSSEYESAIRNGIILEDEVNPDAGVSREDAAKFIIRAMGYEEVANLSGIYNTPFTDVTEYIGQISILNAMNIISGKGDGTFEPKTLLTRADAAIIIYNYLSM